MVSSIAPSGDESAPDASSVGPLADATIISRGERAASWSGSATGAFAAGPATTAEIGRVLEGSMLGPYRLDRFIGGGGMGAVFRALDTTLDRVVAVKVLAGRQADDEEMLKRFRNEAQSAARLDHENIGRVHAVGSEEGWHFIVFEFIEGTNLRDLVRAEGPFDLPRTVDLAIQVADALEHASERDVVHRDIKPSNIVITPAGRARIVDMGLARLPQVADDRDLTVSGMTLGTFDYISPEQARDPRAADVRSDLYSLGCTIFFTLTGRPPFAEGTMVQKLLQHQQAVPPALDDLRDDVPRRFAEIVARLMAKDPLDRYQRPAVLVADLMAFAESQGIQVSTPRPLAWPAEVKEAGEAVRLPWLLPIVGLMAVVVGMWAVSAWQRRAVVAIPPASPGGEGAAVVRVVAIAAGPADTTSLADAIRLVADGGSIELAYDGVRRELPVSVNGKHLVIRAAAGNRPVLEFTGLAAVPGTMLRAACDVGDGDVVVRGVAIRLAGASGVSGGCLFAIRSGRLVGEDLTLGMPGATGSDAASGLPTSAFVSLASAVGGGPIACSLVFNRVRAAGDAMFLDATHAASGRTTLRWVEGALVSPWPLIVSAGTPAEPLEVDCDLDGVEVACRYGVAMLHDASSRPVPARLRMRASDCRFVVSDTTRPFVEQAGEADEDEYRAACQWIDVRSRYEGGGAFRVIDAATERVDEAVRDVVPALFHAPAPGRPPDPASWTLPSP